MILKWVTYGNSAFPRRLLFPGTGIVLLTSTSNSQYPLPELTWKMVENGDGRIYWDISPWFLFYCLGTFWFWACLMLPAKQMAGQFRLGNFRIQVDHSKSNILLTSWMLSCSNCISAYWERVQSMKKEGSLPKSKREQPKCVKIHFALPWPLYI